MYSTVGSAFSLSSSPAIAQYSQCQGQDKSRIERNRKYGQASGESQGADVNGNGERNILVFKTEQGLGSNDRHCDESEKMHIYANPYLQISSDSDDMPRPCDNDGDAAHTSDKSSEGLGGCHNHNYNLRDLGDATDINNSISMLGNDCRELQLRLDTEEDDRYHQQQQQQQQHHHQHRPKRAIYSNNSYLELPFTRSPATNHHHHPHHHHHNQHDQTYHQEQQQQQQQQPHEQQKQRQQKRGKRCGCLTKDKSAIWYLTRLAFIFLVLLGIGVVLTSIFLMLECKDHFHAVRPLLPGTASFCRAMGMPALFATCTVLFTACGLACTGRRLTGYALIVISGVELLQSATTLTFYQCRVLGAARVLAAVNDSLTECQQIAETGSLPPPFEELVLGTPEDYQKAANLAVSGTRLPFLLAAPMAPHRLNGLHSSTLTPPQYEGDFPQLQRMRRMAPMTGQQLLEESSSGIGRRKIGSHLSRETAPIPNIPSATLNRQIFVRVNNRHDHTSTEATIRLEASTGSVLDFNTPRASHPASGPPNVDCRLDSDFFKAVARSASHSLIYKCQTVCKTYSSACQTGTTNYDERRVGESDRYAESGGKLDMVETYTQKSYLTTNAEDDMGLEQDSFHRAVRQCGQRVERKVHDLCYYDNAIILPLSLCAPVAYAMVAVAFIYLAHCDKKLLQDQGGVSGNSNGDGNRDRKITTSESSSSSSSSMIISTSRRHSATSSWSDDSQETSRARRSRFLWLCPPFWRRRRQSLAYRSSSQSSQFELLRLHAVMSNFPAVVGLSVLGESISTPQDPV